MIRKPFTPLTRREKLVRAVKWWVVNNLKQIDQNGISFDESINVLTGGKAGMTLSKRTAIGAGWTKNGQTGPRHDGWCFFCKFLDVVVQKDHCRLQFQPGPTHWSTWVRAGVAFALGLFAVWSLVRLIINLLTGDFN
jgi:hypothetical protein